MRIGLLTREYPPEVYGGAGVHVEYLANELRRLVDVDVHCFGRGPGRMPGRTSRPPELTGANAAPADHRGGRGDRRGHRSRASSCIPTPGTPTSAATSRSCCTASRTCARPTRWSRCGPWKREQLGGGYALSLWCERTALEGADIVIAVSNGMRADVMSTYPGVDPDKVRVIYNGIDTNQYAPDPDTDVLTRYGVDPDRPYVIFVGRVTRQKGLPHLLRAAREFVPEAQLVLLAGQADTPELAAEVNGLIAELTETRQGVIVVEQCCRSLRSSSC